MLDIKTMFLVMASGYLLFGLVMAAYRTQVSERQAIDLWIAGQLCKGLGILLLALRGLIPFTLSISGNFVMYLGFGLELLAYVVYAGHADKRRAVVLLIAVLCAAYAVAHLLTPADAPRNHMNFISSSAIALFSALCALTLLRARDRSRSRVQWVLVAANLAFALTAGLRAFDALLASNYVAVHSNSSGAQFHFAIAYLTMIVTGFGFLLMVKEDGDRLLERLATQDALTGIANRRSFFAKAGPLSPYRST